MKSLLILCCFICLSGCASIISRGNETVIVISHPDNADIIIENIKGRTVYKGKTPAIVLLKRSNGSYFGRESYNIVISKEGYAKENLLVESYPSAWYLFGNIFFGGLIGWFIVDPITGSMYNLRSNDVYIDLTPTDIKGL